MLHTMPKSVTFVATSLMTTTSERTELLSLLSLLSMYSSFNDRRVVHNRLRTFLANHYCDDAFFQLLDDCIDELTSHHPEMRLPLQLDLQTLIFEVKYQHETEESVTELLSIGLIMTSLVNKDRPESSLSRAQINAIATALKEHYINPNAHIVLANQLVSTTSPAIVNFNDAQAIVREMAKLRGVVYSDPKSHLALQDAASDVLYQMERLRSYGLFLRHLLFAVKVPKGETIFHRVPEFSMEFADINQGENPVERYHQARLINDAWNQRIGTILAPNAKGTQLTVLEPMMPVSMDQALTITSLKPRLNLFVQNTVYQLNTQPEELVASIAVFTSDNEEVDYPDEIRVGLSLKSDLSTLIAGDVISISVVENTSVYVYLIDDLLRQFGLDKTMIHPNPHPIDNDEKDTLFLNASGELREIKSASTTLLAQPQGLVLN